LKHKRENAHKMGRKLKKIRFIVSSCIHIHYLFIEVYMHNDLLLALNFICSSRVSDPHPFHADPDPGFETFADADPDPGCEKFVDPDPDPGLHFH